MLIQCKKCNTKHNVIEVQELEDINEFTERQLIISKCNNCNSDMIILIEIRKSDNKPFIDEQCGYSATKIIKREKKRIKHKITNINNHLNGFVYGKNVEIKNKKGKIIQIRQYSSDFKGNKELTKVIYAK